jgi:hypothetical protein
MHEDALILLFFIIGLCCKGAEKQPSFRYLKAAGKAECFEYRSFEIGK